MDFISLSLNNEYNIIILINKLVIVIGLLIIGIWIFKPNIFSKLLGEIHEIDETMIGIGKQRVVIKPNYVDMQIAYKLWVELSTRKIGLPIDFQHDVIVEVYNSWYEFFKITRDLIKEIPISKIRRNESTKEIVKISIDVLNEGLRPHLTTWQARFRKWYTNEVNNAEYAALAPQDIQKNFPEYRSLIANMQEVNQKLIQYRGILEKIAIGVDK